MVHIARTRARDDLAEMFCERMASITRRVKTELDEIRASQAEMSERLIAHYRGVLACLTRETRDQGRGRGVAPSPSDSRADRRV